MEKGTGDSPPDPSSNLSPRSTLGWKSVWGCESFAALEPTKYKPLVRGSSHARSKSLAGAASYAPDGPKTQSLQLERLVGSSPARCKSFVGLPSRGTPDRPKTPPSAFERRSFRSFSPPDAIHEETGGLIAIPESSGCTDGPVSASGGVQQRAADEQGGRAPPFQLWEPVWLQDFPSSVLTAPPSRASSSARDDDTLFSSGSEDMGTVASSVSAAPTPLVQKASNRMEFVSSLNDELLSIKTSMKRAIDLGKKVQRYGALELSQLRGEKANAEAAIRKAVLLTLDLEEQVSNLRSELQKLQLERELEVLSKNNEIRELEMERSQLKKTVREEKNKREKMQSEVDSVLSVLLEEKMKLASERESHEFVLQNEKKKFRRMQKARDAAMKTLEEGNKKLDVERDAMLTAVRDLTSRLDFERDAKLRSMRRSSMEMAAMMRSTPTRPSFGFKEDQSPRSQQLSRSSTHFERSQTSSPAFSS